MHEQEYHSPDGELILVVQTAADGDMTVGFRGFSWHTHANILAAMQGGSEEEAVAQFLDAIFQDRAILAVLSHAGQLGDVWVCDDPESAQKYQQPDETLTFRRWSGQPA